jgi:hypothetical protein
LMIERRSTNPGRLSRKSVAKARLERRGWVSCRLAAPLTSTSIP